MRGIPQSKLGRISILPIRAADAIPHCGGGTLPEEPTAQTAPAQRAIPQSRRVVPASEATQRSLSISAPLSLQVTMRSHYHYSMHSLCDSMKRPYLSPVTELQMLHEHKRNDLASAPMRLVFVTKPSDIQEKYLVLGA